MNTKELLLSYYGDDLTGSTDVMESLALNGVDTVLFTGTPDDDLLDRFKDCEAIGIAGSSRSETPAWMETNLPPIFEWLKGRGAKICHYKVCSTFDSSPTIGSIGRALEIGRSVFGQRCVPVIVGAPELGRYTAFGNLFAKYRGDIYRIDRHPVMSRHPVTPMDEADLLVHLSRQTDLQSSLVDLVALDAEDVSARTDAAVSRSDIVFFDVADRQTQRAAGRQLWRLAGAEEGCFVVGSSGIEYALLASRKAEERPSVPPSFPSPGAVDRLAVVSGSVSPTTERQIRYAAENGFDTLQVDPVALVTDDAERAKASAIAAGSASLAAGRSVLLYTALGPSADRGAEIDRSDDARRRLGQGLGDILARLVGEQTLRRAVIAGGDTSSHALGSLGVDALTVCMPLPQSPGSPLCRAHSRTPSVDGLQVAMKGGQVGADDYFCAIRDGRSGDRTAH